MEIDREHTLQPLLPGFTIYQLKRSVSEAGKLKELLITHFFPCSDKASAPLGGGPRLPPVQQVHAAKDRL